MLHTVNDLLTDRSETAAVTALYNYYKYCTVNMQGRKIIKKTIPLFHVFLTAFFYQVAESEVHH
jgi:hypothetical protein